MNKIEISSQAGDYYTYDPETDFITKNGFIVSSQIYQPLFALSDENTGPVFSGIWNKNDGTIISVTGKINQAKSSKTITLV